MNAIEQTKARVKRRKNMKTLTLSQTREILRYIATADQPEHEHGGFHDNTILAARSALHHLNGRCKCGARLVPVCARLVADAWPKRKTCASNPGADGRSDGAVS